MSSVSGQDADARRFPRRILLVAAGIVVVCGALIVGLRLAVAPLQRLAERRVQAALHQAYGDQLQVKNIHVGLFPGVLELTGITLQRGDPGGPALFSIARASSSTRYWDLVRKPIHIKSVRLQQLEIHVPPRGEGGAAPHQSKAGVKAPTSCWPTARLWKFYRKRAINCRWSSTSASSPSMTLALDSPCDFARF